MGRLEGQVAFITGAGRGQGRAHAVALAREGAAVSLCDFQGQLASVQYEMNRGSELEETARLVAEEGGKACWAHADVRNYEEMERVIDATVERFGRIDIVCANAGSWADSSFATMSPQLWAETVDNNLNGAFNSIRPAVPHMIRQKYGRIVATASTIARKPVPGLAAYAAAKRGVLGLVDALAVELGKHNITVNALCPSAVGTPMTLNHAFVKSLCPDLQNPTMDEAMKALSEVTKLGIPMAEISDITNSLLFFVTDSGRYVTGVAMDINPI